MGSLSVSVALVGLISSAATIRRKITAFLNDKGAQDDIAQNVLSEAACFGSVLSRLQSLLANDAVPIGEHISLDQLGTVLTGCVKRFSEWESLLGGLPSITQAESPSIDPSTWVRSQDALVSTVTKLQPYKRYLLLMIKLFEVQSAGQQISSLQALQSDLERTKNGMISSDPDLAARISKAEFLKGTPVLPTSIPEFPDDQENGEDAMAALQLSPKTSVHDLYSSDAEHRRSHWRSSWRSRSLRRDESARRLRRTPSLITSSSTTSGSASILSTVSSSSRTSLTSISSVRDHPLPISAEDVVNGHHYIGVSPNATSSLLYHYDDMVRLKEAIKSSSPKQPEKALPQLMQPPLDARPDARPDTQPDARPDPRPASALSKHPGHSQNGHVPTAEIEMTASKYSGYWRAMFVAPVPVPVALCGCMLVATGRVAIQAARLNNPDLVGRAMGLRESLEQAMSPAKILKTLDLYSAETMLYALKTSLDESKVPPIAAKLAAPIYQKVAEARDDPRKKSKIRPQLLKSLKKIPQETQVPLMFILNISKLLAGRRLVIDNKPVAIWLMQHFWPPVPSDGAAGEAATNALLEHYGDIPDDMPIALESIKYRFENGIKCDLLDLLTSKRPPHGPSHGK